MTTTNEKSSTAKTSPLLSMLALSDANHDPSRDGETSKPLSPNKAKFVQVVKALLDENHTHHELKQLLRQIVLEEAEKLLSIKVLYKTSYYVDIVSVKHSPRSLRLAPISLESKTLLVRTPPLFRPSTNMVDLYATSTHSLLT